MSVPRFLRVFSRGGNAIETRKNDCKGGERMNDVRQAAEEHAARPKGSPVGASFESERQREKNAFVR